MGMKSQDLCTRLVLSLNLLVCVENIIVVRVPLESIFQRKMSVVISNPITVEMIVDVFHDPRPTSFGIVTPGCQYVRKINLVL